MSILAALTLLILNLACVPSAQAQRHPHFSHYYRNQISYNPAWASTMSRPTLSMLYRLQWFNYASTLDDQDGAPVSQQVHLNYPFVQPSLALGLMLIQDEVGPVRSTFVQWNVSYQVRLSEQSYFGLGMAPNYAFSSTNRNLYRFNSPNDPLLQQVPAQQQRPNLNIGTHYKHENIRIGLGARNLLQTSPSNPFSNLTPSNNPETLAYANYLTKLNEKVQLRKRQRKKTYLTLTPHILWQNDYKGHTSLDAAAILNYYQIFEIGTNLRNAESLTFLTGIHLLKEKNLFLSYSFDLILQNRSTKEGTSHELFLNYSLPKRVKKAKPVKNPRYNF